MTINKRSDRSASSSFGLARVAKGDTVVVIKIPGVLLSREEGLALLRGASLSREGREVTPIDGAMHLCHGADSPETYLYVAPVALAADEVGSELNDAVARLQHDAAAAYPGAQATPLVVTQAVNGASAGHSASWHYVVETDVLPEAEADFNDWYSQEHLPGLAAVSGTVCALRLLDQTGSPRYHALYLLENRETYGSEPWMKVRGTDWSSRVRPNFINSKRTMFRIQPNPRGD